MMKHSFFPWTLIPMLLSGLTACTYSPYYDAPARDSRPYYDERYRYSPYDYYYYPGVAVYFHIHTGHYYYHEHGRWYRVRELPPHIYLDGRGRKHLIIKDDYPYFRHDEHVRIYGPLIEPRGNVDRDRDRSERDFNRRLHDDPGLRRGQDKDDDDERRYQPAGSERKAIPLRDRDTETETIQTQPRVQERKDSRSPERPEESNQLKMQAPSGVRGPADEPPMQRDKLQREEQEKRNRTEANGGPMRDRPQEGSPEANRQKPSSEKNGSSKSKRATGKRDDEPENARQEDEQDKDKGTDKRSR